MFEICGDLDPEVDVDVYIHIESFQLFSYLTVERKIIDLYILQVF